jgi:iron complex transport system substrate-binding protein
MKDINFVTADVIDAAIRIHRELGPGLLESVYETVLAGSLERLGYKVGRQKPINIEQHRVRWHAICWCISHRFADR